MASTSTPMHREAFNQDLSSWDVSSVVSMEMMFYEASAFNGNLSSWNVSCVVVMDNMFNSASAFNGDLSSWDISRVDSLNWMFNHATSFNQDLCAWVNDFPYGEADDIFDGSGCTFQVTPQIDHRGPFCDSDCHIAEESSAPVQPPLPDHQPVNTETEDPPYTLFGKDKAEKAKPMAAEIYDDTQHECSSTGCRGIAALLVFSIILIVIVLNCCGTVLYCYCIVMCCGVKFLVL